MTVCEILKNKEENQVGSCNIGDISEAQEEMASLEHGQPHFH